MSNCSKTVFLLDQLVGGHLHDQRHLEAECLRRFEIDDEFELRGLLDRKLGGLLTFEDANDMAGSAAVLSETRPFGSLGQPPRASYRSAGGADASFSLKVPRYDCAQSLVIHERHSGHCA